MAKRIGVFADVSNLYYTIKGKYKRKLDYGKFMEFIADLGDVAVSLAYGAQREDQAQKFIKCLREAGFTPKYKEPRTFNNKSQITHKADWDVGIAVDMIRYMDDVDMYILASADSDMIPVIEYLNERGKEVVVIGCGISHQLKDSTKECIEIAKSLTRR